MMDRLTIQLKNRGYAVLKDNVPLGDAIQRLARYENTGLSPEEIIRLREGQPLEITISGESKIIAEAVARMLAHDKAHANQQQAETDTAKKTES